MVRMSYAEPKEENKDTALLQTLVKGLVLR